MSDRIKIPALVYEQPIGRFYVGKIDYKTLINMCSKDMKDIEERGKYDIYQRKLDPKRIPALKSYMEYSRATFPNGVILNSRYPIEFNGQEITIQNDRDTFFIIDGQHRIEALKYYSGDKPFDMCVVIFDRIDIDLQTDIFATVNTEQKKVNPSVKMNLRGNDKVDTPEKVARRIAITFNDDEESPFCGRIKFNDESVKKDELKISLASFIGPIVDNIYNCEKSFDIKDCLYLNQNDRTALEKSGITSRKELWKYYINSDDEIIYLMLLNYFTAISDILHDDWNDNKSLLAKTSGYNALMRLFIDVLRNTPQDMSYDKLASMLQPIANFSGHFVLDEIGVGNSASIRLYKKFAICLGFIESDSEEGFFYPFDEQD